MAIQEDYILRMIQMMAEMILAALKLKDSGKVEEAEQTLARILESVLPGQADLIEMVDVRTAHELMGDPRLVEYYIELLLERAEIKMAHGESDTGQVLQERAALLFMESLNKHRKLTPKGNLLWGRLAGIDLHKTLSVEDMDSFENLKQLIEAGIIPTA